MGGSHKSNIAMAGRKTSYEGFVSTHGPKHNHGDFNTAKCDDKGDGGKTKQQEWLRKDPQNDSVEHGETKQRKDYKVVRTTFPNWEGKNNKRSFVIVGDELRFMDPHASGGGVATTIFERAK